jgi:hypothetical protein
MQNSSSFTAITSTSIQNLWQPADISYSEWIFTPSSFTPISTHNSRRTFDQRPRQITGRGAPSWRCPHGVWFWIIRTDFYRWISSTCLKCCLFAGRNTKNDLHWVRENFFEWKLENEQDEYPLLDSDYEVDWDNLTPRERPLAGMSSQTWSDIRWSDHYNEESGFNLASLLLFGRSGELGTLLSHRH